MSTKSIWPTMKTTRDAMLTTRCFETSTIDEITFCCIRILYFLYSRSISIITCFNIFIMLKDVDKNLPNSTIKQGVNIFFIQGNKIFKKCSRQYWGRNNMRREFFAAEEVIFLSEFVVYYQCLAIMYPHESFSHL